jgi:purine-binding chemotaxis protein CheW
MGAGRTSTKKDAAELAQVCSVRLGDGRYGIPIGHILEIVGGARPQNVPLAPEFVGGLMHYRGDVLTTVSLRRLFGLPPSETSQDLLVVESADGAFGLLVDAVMEVLTVSAAEFESNPSTVCKPRLALFAGAYKLKDGLMVMLDPERLQPMRLANAS